MSGHCLATLHLTPLESTVANACPTPSISTTAIASYRYRQAKNPLGWVFGLSAFRDLDVAKQALVLPPLAHEYSSTGASSREHILSDTVVDARLELERGSIK